MPLALGTTAMPGKSAETMRAQFPNIGEGAERTASFCHQSRLAGHSAAPERTSNPILVSIGDLAAAAPVKSRSAPQNAVPTREARLAPASPTMCKAIQWMRHVAFDAAKNKMSDHKTQTIAEVCRKQLLRQRVLIHTPRQAAPPALQSAHRCGFPPHLLRLRLMQLARPNQLLRLCLLRLCVMQRRLLHLLSSVLWPANSRPGRNAEEWPARTNDQQQGCRTHQAQQTKLNCKEKTRLHPLAQWFLLAIRESFDDEPVRCSAVFASSFSCEENTHRRPQTNAQE